jgi:hypothetical protein
VSAPEATAPGRVAYGLDEAARLHWREDASPATLRRDGRRWTAWTAWIATVFCVPGVLLLAIEPLTFPAAAICFAHAWAIPRIQARRGARQVVPIGSERSVARRADAASGPERVAFGLLGDLVGHAERDLLAATGLALERGELGAWLIGEQGAILVRPGGRRVDCWCVRVAEQQHAPEQEAPEHEAPQHEAPQQRRGSATPRRRRGSATAREQLPAGDRVAHLLLAVREDELGFAKVANLGFSGARWRVRRHLPPMSRPALDSARAAAG